MQWKKNTNLQKPKNLSWQPLPFLLLVSVSSGKILSALKMPKELTAEQDTFVGQFSLDIKPLTGKRIERGLKLLHFVLCRAFADPWRHQGMRKYILQYGMQQRCSLKILQYRIQQRCPTHTASQKHNCAFDDNLHLNKQSENVIDERNAPRTTN